MVMATARQLNASAGSALDNDNATSLGLELENCTSSSHPELVVFAPELTVVKLQEKWFFMVHTYGFACFFSFLGFYSFFSILNLRSQISSRPYMSTINGFLCLLGVSRAACLLIDPYDLKETMPSVIGSIMWDVGFPCLISTFGLIQLAFLQFTQLHLGPEKLRRKSCLSLVITTHFSCVIAVDILTNFQPDIVAIRYVIQTVFVIWGLFLCGTFLYGGYKVISLLKTVPSAIFHQRETAANDSKGLLQLSLLAPFHNLNLATSVTAAIAPTLLTPKIRITDENEQTFSYASDNSHISNQNVADLDLGNMNGRGSPHIPVRPSTPVPGCTSMSRRNSSSEDPLMVVRPPSPDPRRSSTTSLHSRNSFSTRGALGVGGMQSRRTSGASVGMGSCSSRRGSESSRRGSEGVSLMCSSPGASRRALMDSGVGIGAGVGLNMGLGGAGCSGGRRNSRRAVEPDYDGVETSLLSSSGGLAAASDAAGMGDGESSVTLHSILNHIAYVNQAAMDYKDGQRKSRKSQVQKVLHVTYATAVIGVLLCLADVARIYSTYGLFASETPPYPWPWFAFQTVSRLLELVMSGLVANVTKQPVNRHSHYAYSLQLKHRESLYM